MAIEKPIWSEDRLTLSNVLLKDRNTYGTYNVVTTWYDGTPMDDTKIDDDLVYVKYEGKYLRQNFSDWGEVFLEKDTISQMRSLSTYEILLLKAGRYKGVTLNGYYIKNDTPSPINYYLSNTTEEDNSGDIIEVFDIKLKHDFGNEVNLVYFGDADSRTDWKPIVDKLVNNQKKIILENSKQYNISNTLSYIDKNVFIDGNNSYFQLPLSTSNANLLNITTTSLPINNVLNIEDYVPTSGGIRKITYTGERYEIGDILKIFSDDVFSDPKLLYDFPTQQYCGEFLNVINIVENSPNNYTITIQGDLYYNYSTNIRITKIPTSTCKIENLNIDNKFNGQAIFISRMFSPVINNISVKRSGRPAFALIGNYLPKVLYSNVSMIEDAVSGVGRPSTVGYGVNVSSNYGLKVIGCNFSGLRHAFTTGGREQSATDWLQRGMEKNAIVALCNANNCQIPFDSHAVGRDLVFNSNTIDNCAQAFQVRCGYTTISNNNVSNCRTFLFSYNDSIHNTKLLNNTFQGKGTSSIIQISRKGTSDVQNGRLIINGGYYEGFSLLNIDRCSVKVSAITNVTVKDANSRPYISTGSFSKLQITNSTFEQSIDDLTTSHWFIQPTSNCEIYLDSLTFENVNTNNICRTGGTSDGNNSLIAKNLTFLQGSFIMTTKDVIVHPASVQYFTKIKYSDIKKYGTTDSTSNYTTAAYGGGTVQYDINRFIEYKDENSIIVLGPGGTPSGTIDLSSYILSTNAVAGKIFTIINKSERDILLPTLGTIITPTLPNEETISIMYSGNNWRYIKNKVL